MSLPQILSSHMLKQSPRPTPRPWVRYVLVGAVLVIAEVVGRFAENDVVDLFVLGMVLFFLGVAHAIKKFGFIAAGVQALKRFGNTLVHQDFELGVDFRGQPAIPRKFPQPLGRIIVIVGVLNLLLVPVLFHMPTGLRELLQPRLYLLYLALLGMMWFSALMMGLISCFVAYACIRDAFVMAYRKQPKRNRKAEFITLIVCSLLLASAIILLPPELPVCLALSVLLFVTLTHVATSQGFVLLWRGKESEAVHSLDGRWYSWCAGMQVSLCLLLLMLVTNGQTIVLGHAVIATSKMPFTLLMGQVYNWLAIPGLLGIAVASARFTRLGIVFNPLRQLRQRGDKPVAREWEIQQRRQLMKGLKFLFKRKARLSADDGTGVWIGLQHWYITGMSRDQKEDDAEATTIDHMIGPPYYRVFSRASRLHFWEICKATKVDLILVEDGITFRRFTRVIRMLFEIYDIHGGEQPAEELHFTGLPGVRVVLHEFDLAFNEELDVTDYPEPDYNQIARGRILHIFKDRGEVEEFDPLPPAFDYVPDLVGAY